MPFFMFTASYKPEAIKAMVGNPQDRGEAVKPLMAALGITLHHLFFMVGKDDIVAIMEGPDDETAAAAPSRGSETLPAAYYCRQKPM